MSEKELDSELNYDISQSHADQPQPHQHHLRPGHQPLPVLLRRGDEIQKSIPHYLSHLAGRGYLVVV